MLNLPFVLFLRSQLIYESLVYTDLPTLVNCQAGHTGPFPVSLSLSILLPLSPRNTVNSYPRSTRTQVISYPQSTRTQVVVPKVNSYPKTKETQRNDIGRSQIMIGITHVRTSDGAGGGGYAGWTECVIGVAVVAFRPENCVRNSLSQLMKINL